MNMIEKLKDTHIKGGVLAKQLDITTETLRRWHFKGYFLAYTEKKTFLVDMRSFADFFRRHSNVEAVERMRKYRKKLGH